jgi:hypothetical protein
MLGTLLLIIVILMLLGSVPACLTAAAGVMHRVGDWG